MKVRLLILLAVFAAVACEQGETTPPIAIAEAPQCHKDTDCKRDRICESGMCVFPPPEEREAIAMKPAKAPSPHAVPVCEAGDGRTRLPVWTPEVDSNGNLSSDPPTKDGQITFIELWTDAGKVTCNNKELNSFRRPTNPRDPMEGGLAVNLRGNTQFANGMCYFRGYYMNEDVMGMHQGWVETYFGAVDKEKIVLSDKFCLSRPLP